MKGYKVLNPDWTCQGHKYEVGQTYEFTERELGLCNYGAHFCARLADCFSYYSFDPDNKVAEIEAVGKVIEGDNKSVTDEIRIVREISWEEMLRLVNTGKGNSGYRNSGDRNSGNGNSGDRNSGNGNSGYWNSGNWNSGDWNSGYRNSGYRNSGDRNSGNWNSGDWNSGYRNSGDWNIGNGNSGAFNSDDNKIYLFNKLSDWTLRDWQNSDASCLLQSVKFETTEWIEESSMSEDDKTSHPESHVLGGYLKTINSGYQCQSWWDGLCDSEKAIITSLPNFDAEIFKQITGAQV